MINTLINKKNSFNFPPTTKEIILIANGKGINPFLGMINNEKKEQVKTYLFWGGPTKDVLKMYTPLIDKAFYSRTLSGFYSCFSKEPNARKYVQNLIMEKVDLITRVLKNNGTIMICGSVDMQKGVLNTIEDITKTELNEPLSTYKNNKQIKIDCY